MKIKQAIFLQMMFPGCPCVYYGDEIGLEGGKDPDCRRTMPWDKNAWNLEIFNWTKRMILLRKQHDAIMKGDYQTIYFPAYPKLIGFLRNEINEKIIGLVNNSDDSLSVSTDLFLPYVNPQAGFYDLLSEENCENQKDIHINPEAMVLLKQKLV